MAKYYTVKVERVPHFSVCFVRFMEFELGYIYALLATVLWSGNAVAARFLAESTPAIGVSFWRWAVALIICFPATYPAFRRNIPAVKKHWKYLTVLALLGVAMFNTMLYWAAHTTTAFNIAVISTTLPIFILVITLFMGERLSRVNFLGFIIANAGIVSLVTDASPEKLLQMQVAEGDFIMLAAAAVFAIYTILVRRKPAEISINTMVFCTFHVGTLMLLPLYIVQEMYFTPVVFGFEQVTSFIYIGVFASFVAFMSWNRAVVMIGAAKSGAVYYSIPVFSGLLAFILLGEAITVIDIISMCIVAFGVYLVSKK